MRRQDIARDEWGRSLTQLAADMWRLQGGFQGIDGDPGTIAFLVNTGGLSAIDANFVADYAGIDKAALAALISGGKSGYEALSAIYGAPYLPNVDATPAAGFRWPSYLPNLSTYLAMLRGGSSPAQILAAAPAPLPSPPAPPPASNPATTPGATPAATPAATPGATGGTLPFGIPATIMGIPTLFLAGGLGLAYFLSK